MPVVDFAYPPEIQAFQQEVREFIKDNYDPDIMDPRREGMAQLVDTPKRRAFMKKLGERGWLGMSWPEEYGGSGRSGLYEYVLNEELAAVGAPYIGKGIGIVGKTIIRHGSEKLKQEFLPKILANDIEFAIGYTEPNAGSDLAALEMKAVRDDDNGGWRLSGQKRFTTSAHFAEWYWLAARTDPDGPKHKGVTLFLLPMEQDGIQITNMPTMGDERVNEVYLDDVFVSDDYVVGEVGKGFVYVSEALDFERFTLFTVSAYVKRYERYRDHVRTADAQRPAAQGRPARARAGGRPGHPRRGRQDADPAGDRQGGAGRGPQHRGRHVQALDDHHRAGRVRGVHGARTGRRARSSATRPPPRWTACSSTPSATRWSTPSAPAPPRCSATSSPAAASACP